VIDLHCHVLCGLDDGPATLEDAVDLARAAVAGGTHTVVATPHVSARYPNDPAAIGRRLGELRVRLQTDGVALELIAGAEIALTQTIDMNAQALQRMSLGEGPWLLVEPPFAPFVSGVEEMLRELQGEGHRLLLAHPERCPTFHRDPAMLEGLVASGIRTSLTAGSLQGRFGETVRGFALGLVDAELVHNVASDAHDTTRRGPAIAPALEGAGLQPLAEWLVHEVPAAILSGAETIPPRPRIPLATPQRPRRPRWGRRLLRRAS
jgi:protein-tyrosine phosphatase